MKSLSHKLIFGFIILLLIGMFAGSANAQEYDYSWPWTAMLQSGGYTTVINGVTFTFSVVFDETQGGQQTGPFMVMVTVVGQGFNEQQEFQLAYEAPAGGMFIFGAEGQAFLAWMNPILAQVNALSSGDVLNSANTVPSNPVAGQAIRTFRTTVFSEPVESRAEMREQGEITAGKTPTKLNEISSDVEYEFFKFYGDKGNNLAIHAGYARTLYDLNLTLGGNFAFNNLKMDNWDESLNNSDAALFAKKVVSEGDNSRITVGLNLDLMLFDKDYIEDTGIGIGAMGSGRNYFGEYLLSWGGLYQYTIISDFKAHYLSVGAMFGMPIGEKLTVSVDALGTYTLGISVDGESVDIDEPLMLNLGGSLGMYISKAFSLNGGVKTVLLVDEYSSFELLLGAGYRF